MQTSHRTLLLLLSLAQAAGSESEGDRPELQQEVQQGSRNRGKLLFHVHPWSLPPLPISTQMCCPGSVQLVLRAASLLSFLIAVPQRAGLPEVERKKPLTQANGKKE